ncbi:MAG TPA: GNAT family N-acetyltransferase [Ferruginibacter sp.]|nr:GNAT family N-acetyltransferase [Ferruginibacter sp.]HPH90765.1 GNAT family N-acetyltransferase [Ferruginibacter sp.]
MLKPNFEPFPVIVTSRLLLREVTIADAADLFFLRSDAAVLKYLDKEPEKSVDETIALINQVKKNKEDGDGILWGITLKDSNILVGSICYWRMQKEHYRAEIGYALHPAQQGKGIMDEAIKAVLQYGFETMQLHSVEANVNPANEASMKLLERNGFVKEAHFRENYYYNGQFLDSVIFSLITPLK